MSAVQTPNLYEGSDVERIQQAVDAAAAEDGRVVIPRVNRGRDATTRRLWLLDEAIRLPSHITVELDGCHLKLSDRCRDNFFRSANCGMGIDPIEPMEGIHVVGLGRAILEGADRPRATGDRAKTLGERTFGTDAGAEGNNQKGDWRNLGILLAHVENFSLQNLTFVDSHCWAISLEYCSHGLLRDLSFDSTGSKKIDGQDVTILNQDGIDLRQGCHDLLIENITGRTGDDLVALTAIPHPERPAGSLLSTMITGSGDTSSGIRSVIIRNVRGHSAAGNHIVRLLNTCGLPMENILVDGVIDTSLSSGRRPAAAVKIGDKFPQYGGVNPLGTTRRIVVNHVISRAGHAVLIGGSLCDSSISNITQYDSPGDPVCFQSGPENVRAVAVHNARNLTE